MCFYTLSLTYYSFLSSLQGTWILKHGGKTILPYSLPEPNLCSGPKAMIVSTRKCSMAPRSELSSVDLQWPRNSLAWFNDCLNSFKLVNSGAGWGQRRTEKEKQQYKRPSISANPYTQLLRSPALLPPDQDSPNFLNFPRSWEGFLSFSSRDARPRQRDVGEFMRP